jgi:N-methylhydantoinase B
MRYCAAMTSGTAPHAPTSSSDGIGMDPILFSVLMRRLEGIAQEMSMVLEASSWTSIIALCHDFSCVIYDKEARQVCMYDALPAHTTSMQLVIQEITRTFGPDIHEGDVIMTNDPYRGNTHIGDIVCATPVFVDGCHLFWSASKAHHMDVGAFIPSSCTASSENVYQEGITIPPVKIVARGERRADVIDFFLSNVRYRELVDGDLLAQMGSIETGRKRLTELCVEFGTEVILGYVDEVLAYADRRMGEAIAAMPDGTYHGEGWVDTDGFQTTDIPIKAAVTIAGDRAIVDFDGCGPQAKGGMNGTQATTLSAGVIPFLLMVDPDIPHNEGCVSHIEVRSTEGTIANPRYPASSSCATIVPAAMLHDAVNKAMASAIPELVPAGTGRCGNVPVFSGVDPRSGAEWAMMVFNNSQGSGATAQAEGWPLIESPAAAGGQKSLAIEQMELLYPVLIERMEVEPEAQGFGRHNGGCGVRMVVAPIGTEMDCITFGDGCANPPHGVLGGTAGIGGGQYVEDRAGGPRRFISASGYVTIADGQAWVGVATGGGGYGDPAQRDPEQVRRDARDGLISRATAAEVFGVVLSDDEDPVLDVQATVHRRAQLSERPSALVTPDGPGAATWLAETMRDGDVYLINPA